ncbi:MAG: DUF817 domain-containing protein [Nitriliruptorales bacterium]|nr:DUF817 domain-containing protein [Nitriliruptorales bacterium]
MSSIRVARRTELSDRLWRGAEDLVWFGFKEAIACAMPLGFFAILAFTRVVDIPGLARYDAVLLLAIALQVALVATGFETWADVKVAARFHLLGLILELFKTHPAVGSWSYPETAVAKLGTVPLYSGFMYAAVASYMIAAWRLLRLRFTNYPAPWVCWAIAAAVYLNFFTHHWGPDLRWVLIAAVVAVFGRTRVHFRPRATERWMPVPVAFGLIAFFVWLAENLSTFLGAWIYPDQAARWEVVSLGKLSSWSLLVIVSFVIVGEVMRRRHGLHDAPPRRVRGPGWRRLSAILTGT